MTIVINLLGGPGCGKSTLAASVYSRMKERHLDVELVRECVKGRAYRGEKIGKYDELTILADQLREESNLYGRVKYIVTDRPLSLSVVYQNAYNANSTLMSSALSSIRAMQELDGIKNVDFIVRRNDAEYNRFGRFESYDEAVKIDTIVKCVHPHAKLVSTTDEVLRMLGFCSKCNGDFSNVPYGCDCEAS